MSTIRFIIQGAEASSTALELEHYLKSELKIDKIEKQKQRSSFLPADAQSKGVDPESIKILLAVYGLYKVGKDAQEVVEDLQKLSKWLVSGNYEGIKLDINGTLYPVIDEQIDNIVQELEKT